MSTPRKNGDHAGLRIAMQYRSKRSMVYELECNGSELQLVVAPRSNEGDTGEWCVQARPGREPGVVSIVQWGPTPGDALREVARQWMSQIESAGLPSFDWEAVSKLLAEVHAL